MLVYTCSHCGYVLYVYPKGRSRFKGPQSAEAVARQYDMRCPVCGAPLQPAPRKIIVMPRRVFLERYGDGGVFLAEAQGDSDTS